MNKIDAYLSAVKARAAAATGGPWECYWHLKDGRKGDCSDDFHACVRIKDDEYGQNYGIVVPSYIVSKANLEFIAHARTDVDRLVAIVEAARKALEAQCDGYVVPSKATAARAALDELDRLAGEGK